MIKEFMQNGQTVINNLILDNFQQLGMTNDEFIIWLLLYRNAQEGNYFPDANLISQKLNLPLNTVFTIINSLIQKELILIAQSEDEVGKKVDYYDLSPIYQRIEDFMNQNMQRKSSENKQERIKELFQSFEEEFGRPLSAIEYQRINQWLQEDHYSAELIYFALKEAVINQAYSLNYIDRVLLSWERKNISTPQQVQEEQRKRKNHLKKQDSTSTIKGNKPQITLHNWLEEK